VQDKDYLASVVQQIVADREALACRLRQIPGVEPFPSQTNFILMKLPVENAKPIVNGLAGRGIYVRYFGDPELQLQDCIRASVGTPDRNAIFAEELEQLVREATK
jgi:histidinol-phosphate aminotransferase